MTVLQMPRRDAVGFGTSARELREAAGVSQRQFADRVPMSRSYLCEIELGKRTPSPELAAHIDETLGAGGRLTALVSATNRRQYAPARFAAGGDSAEHMESGGLAMDAYAAPELLSPVMSVPASAGPSEVNECGISFPRADVAMVNRVHGCGYAIDLLLVVDGFDTGVTMTPDEARLLASYLRVLADEALGNPAGAQR